MTRGQLLTGHKNYLGRLAKLFEILHGLQYTAQVECKDLPEKELVDRMLHLLELFDSDACNELGDFFKTMYNRALDINLFGPEAVLRRERLKAESES